MSNQQITNKYGTNYLEVESDGSINVNASITASSSTLTINQVTVNNTATIIKAANTSRESILVTNIGIVTVWVGSDNTVTAGSSGNGEQLLPMQSVEFKTTSAIYGIVTTGTCRVCYSEEA